MCLSAREKNAQKRLNSYTTEMKQNRIKQKFDNII